MILHPVTKTISPDDDRKTEMDTRENTGFGLLFLAKFLFVTRIEAIAGVCE